MASMSSMVIFKIFNIWSVFVNIEESDKILRGFKNILNVN